MTLFERFLTPIYNRQYVLSDSRRRACQEARLIDSANRPITIHCRDHLWIA